MSTLKVNTITALNGDAPDIPGFEGGSGSGASAWGNFDGIGGVVLNGALNVDSVVRTNTGQYTVTFSTPMPDANYSVVCSTMPTPNGNDSGAMPRNLTANGFDIDVQNFTNALVDSELVTFTVFATNALPPKSGTGTDSWATVDLTTVNGPCNVPSSFNVASVTRTGTGSYSVVFTTPMPTSDYSVTVGVESLNSLGSGSVRAKTITGFQIFTGYVTTNQVIADFGFNFTVNATNATLPQTVTQEQIDSAINNPGASAWARTAADGTLLNGMNFASVVQNGLFYDYVFSTPMPDANYSIVGMPETNGSIRSQNVTANGFQININNPSATGSLFVIHSVAVFATNALPPKSGTGADSWGSVQSDGTIDASFNVSTVTKTGTGIYDVVFTTPMPTASYSTMGSVAEDSGSFLCFYGKTTTGFTARIQNYEGTSVDRDYSFTVNATNATLPTTFTEAQIQSVIDAQPQGIAKAWVNFNGTGTVAIRDSLNINSITDNGTGDYRINFTAPMSNSNYSAVVSGNHQATNTRPIGLCDDYTATGFRVTIEDVTSFGASRADSNIITAAVFSS